jgi:hypothetical protein
MNINDIVCFVNMYKVNHTYTFKYDTEKKKFVEIITRVSDNSFIVEIFDLKMVINIEEYAINNGYDHIIDIDFYNIRTDYDDDEEFYINSFFSYVRLDYVHAEFSTITPELGVKDSKFYVLGVVIHDSHLRITIGDPHTRIDFRIIRVNNMDIWEFRQHHLNELRDLSQYMAKFNNINYMFMRMLLNKGLAYMRKLTKNDIVRFHHFSHNMYIFGNYFTSLVIIKNTTFNDIFITDYYYDGVNQVVLKGVSCQGDAEAINPLAVTFLSSILFGLDYKNSLWFIPLSDNTIMMSIKEMYRFLYGDTKIFEY